ncbi:MAG TPA: type II toxin-antitoxin system VapC family toxin [Pseudonocardiaceae bacterium]|nr:type II toxin-antitoxin system VapC family toxin [Pseudonocardiaceae bacterium]
MIVVDASVLDPALADDSDEGDHFRRRLCGQRLAAPELIDLEVRSVLRSGVRRGLLDERRARLAWSDLVDAPLHRAPHRPLLPRTWELRDNLTTYVAAYVALAEILGTTLLTTDGKLTNVPGIRCEVELIQP